MEQPLPRSLEAVTCTNTSHTTTVGTRSRRPPTMAVFPIDEAQLISLFMEAVTYGVYLVTLGMCIQALFMGSVGREGRSRNWPLIIVAAAMFVFETLNIACSLRFSLDAFIFYKGSGGPTAVFRKISYAVNVMKVHPSFAVTSIVPSDHGLVDCEPTNDGPHRGRHASESHDSCC